MAQRRLSIIRPIAVAIVMAFTAEQAAFAAPALPTIMPTSLKPEVGFRLPESVAVVDDAYKAPGSSKLIVLIQDAHTNDSGQMNVAKALAEILPKEKISTVFTEADSGDKSLNYMKPFFSQEVRESVGRSLVRKGLLRGHDYANLVGKDFTLWGVEDPALYKETLEVYKDITLKRDKVRAYVDRVQRAADVIKGDVFSDEVRDLDAQRIKNAKGDLSLADYAELLLKEAGRSGLSTAQYPHIKFLRRLRAIEKRVDFKKASTEEREAIKVLPQADRDELLAVHKNGLKATTEESGFYALFAEKLKGRESNFPDLARYFEYLKETRKMNALGVVGEVKGLEEDLFMRLSKTQDEAVLWTLARNLETLQNLVSLKVSPEEYNRIKTQSSLYDIKLIAGFLNRKISDAGKHYENALTLESSYEAVWKDASDFYELTLKRDRVFFDRLTAKMSLDNVDKAVLITGGYHTPNLKAMLKSAGISYVSLLPQVLTETDTPRYERLLLAQLKDQNTDNTRIAVGSRPARQTAAMTMQMQGARLAEALTHEAAGNVPVALVMAARPASDQGAVSGARMADLTPVLLEGQKSVLMPLTPIEVAYSSLYEITGNQFTFKVDATPDNVTTPTVVTLADTSKELRFTPVAAAGVVISPAKSDGAEEAFSIALPTSVRSFDVQVKAVDGKFLGVLRVVAQPVSGVGQGPFIYNIGVDFVPGRLMTAVAARMADVASLLGKTPGLPMTQLSDLQGELVAQLEQILSQQSVRDELKNKDADIVVVNGEAAADPETSRLNPDAGRVVIDERILDQLNQIYGMISKAENKQKFVHFIASGLANAMLHIGRNTPGLPGSVNLETEVELANIADHFGYTELTKLAYLFAFADPSAGLTPNLKEKMVNNLLNKSREQYASYHSAQPIIQKIAPEYHFAMVKALESRVESDATAMSIALYHLSQVMHLKRNLKIANLASDSDFAAVRKFLEAHRTFVPGGATAEGPTPYDAMMNLLLWSTLYESLDSQDKDFGSSSSIKDPIGAGANVLLRDLQNQLRPFKVGTFDEPGVSVAFPDPSDDANYTTIAQPLGEVQRRYASLGVPQDILQELRAPEGETDRTVVTIGFLKKVAPYVLFGSPNATSPVQGVVTMTPGAGLGTRAMDVDLTQATQTEDPFSPGFKEGAKSSMQLSEATILEHRIAAVAGQNESARRAGVLAPTDRTRNIPMIMLTSHFTEQDTQKGLDSLGYRTMTVTDLRNGRESQDGAILDIIKNYGISDKVLALAGDQKIAFHDDIDSPVVYLLSTHSIPFLDPQTGNPLYDSTNTWPYAHAWVLALASSGLEPALGRNIVVGSNVDNMVGTINPLVAAFQVSLGTSAMTQVLPVPDGQKGGAPTSGLVHPTAAGQTAMANGFGALATTAFVEGFEMYGKLFEQVAESEADQQGIVEKADRDSFVKKRVNALIKEYMPLFNSANYVLSNQYFDTLARAAGLSKAEIADLSATSDGQAEIRFRLARVLLPIMARLEFDKRFAVHGLGMGQTTILQGSVVTYLDKATTPVSFDYPDPKTDPAAKDTFVAAQKFIFGPVKTGNPRNIRLRAEYLDIFLNGSIAGEKITEKTTAKQLKESHEAGTLTVDLSGTSFEAVNAITRAIGDLIKYFGSGKDVISIEAAVKQNAKDANELKFAEEAVDALPGKYFWPGARVVESHAEAPVEGARLAESSLAQGLALVGGFENVEQVTLAEVADEPTLAVQLGQYQYLAYQYLKTQPDGVRAEVPFVVMLDGQRVGLLAATAQKTDRSINLSEGERSMSVGETEINKAVPAADQRAGLDDRAALMSQQSEGMKEADLALAGVIATAPIVSLATEAAGILKNEDKFDLFLKDLAAKFTRMRAGNSGLGLVVETKGLSDAQIARAKSVFAKGQDAGWAHLIDSVKDADAAVRYQDLRSRYFLVDVVQNGMGKSANASAAVQTQASSDKSVTDWFAVGALLGNAIKATGIRETTVDTFRSAFEGELADIQADAENLAAINKAFQKGGEFTGVVQFVETFKNGTYGAKSVIRVYVMPIGQMLQTMRMMVAQVAMAA